LLDATIGEEDVACVFMARACPRNGSIRQKFQQAGAYLIAIDRKIVIASEDPLRISIGCIYADEVTDVFVAKA